jgi:hypothetical protein
MTEIRYGVFCEDTAQKIFIENILPQIACKDNKNIKLIKDLGFELIWSKSKSKTKVIKHLNTVCNQAIVLYDLNLCLIGYDLDYHSEDDYKKNIDNFYAKIKNDFEDYYQIFIIFIPVQAIEYWLWYIKIHKDRPDSNKTEKFEQKTKEMAKNAVYGNKNARNMVTNQIVGELTQDVNLNKLINASNSFKDFYNRFSNFLKMQ